MEILNLEMQTFSFHIMFSGLSDLLNLCKWITVSFYLFVTHQ